CMQGIEFPLTL
nr:immunoglobulin light chain junction region [Macaca mulatta]